MGISPADLEATTTQDSAASGATPAETADTPEIRASHGGQVVIVVRVTPPNANRTATKAPHPRRRRSAQQDVHEVLGRVFRNFRHSAAFGLTF